MKPQFPIAVLLAVTGCSSITPIPVNEWVIDYGRGCVVSIYQTVNDAEKDGEIVELCVIEGTSSGSFKHTPETAIRKHAKKACECNTDKVYVQSRARADWGVAKASMVAFRFVEQNETSDTSSYISELRSLEALRDDGVITENEFQRQKAKIFSRQNDH